MIEKLLIDIENYTDFLKNEGLYVTIHVNISEYMYKLSKFNIHYNPFCVIVKSDDCAWEKCIKSQDKIYKLKRSEPFWGMCHAGIEEYIFPLYADEMFGFLCVSGYAVNKEKALNRIKKLAEEFFIDETKLTKVYDTKLYKEKPNLKDLSILINPLVHMLTLLYILKPAEVKNSQSLNGIYNTALSYIERNFMKDISLEKIAKECNCSVSSLCHIFKTHCKKSVKHYILELRMKQAANLLRNTDLSVKNISGICGFSEPDYFSAFFKKFYKKSPTKYRK